MLPPIDYDGNGCSYSINISNRRFIEVQIEDKINRKTLKLNITEPMLRDYSLTIEELRSEMYKQYIHQRLRDKQLLSYRQGYLVIKFTYPKCTVKPITFKCQWKSLNQQALNMQHNMKQTFQKNFDHFSKQIDDKLTQAMMAMQNKFFSLNKSMDQRNEQRLSNIYLRCEQMLQQNEQKTNKILKKQQEDLIDSNLRYFDEFKLIKTDLQTSIINCDLNIKELSRQVSDIQFFVLENQKETKDQLQKIANDMIDLQSFQRRDQIAPNNQESFTLFNAVNANAQTSHFSNVKPSNFDVKLIEELMDKDRKRFDEKFKQIKQQLESLKNLESNADRNLNQLREQRVEIESKHAKKQIYSNASGTMTTNFSFSLATSLQKSSRMQETFQTTIREEMDERQPSQVEPLLNTNSINQFQIGLILIEQDKQQDASPSY